MPVKSEVHDLHPPAAASYRHCLRLRSEGSNRHTDLCKLQRPPKRPSDELQTFSKKAQGNYGTEEEEIQVIARDILAVGNLGENETQKKSICPVPEEG